MDDPRGMGQVFQSTANAYYEWHQVFKVEATYAQIIVVEASETAEVGSWVPVATYQYLGAPIAELDHFLRDHRSGDMK